MIRVMITILFACVTVKGEEGSGEVPIEVDFAPTKRPSSYLRIEKLNSIDDCTITSRPGDKLSVFYIGKFENGEIFDFKTKKRRNDKGFTFTLGARQVIQGWDIGLRDMCVGEQRILTIGPDLAYDSIGVPGFIPPHATLKFHVILGSISRPRSSGSSRKPKRKN